MKDAEFVKLIQLSIIDRVTSYRDVYKRQGEFCKKSHGGLLKRKLNY